MQSILNRIRLVINQSGLSDSAFAKSLNVPQATFSNMFQRESEPKPSWLELIISKYKVNAHWLLTGEGNMFVDEPGTAVAEPVAKIPLLRQSVSCGPGEEWQDADSVECYIEPMHLLPSLKDRPVYAFRARGTSMVGAGIDDGDIILFDGERGQIVTDDLYVFALNGSVFCKLVKFDEITGRIRIYSMHTENIKDAELLKELDPSNSADADTFRLFGRVLAWMHENRLMSRH